MKIHQFSPLNCTLKSVPICPIGNYAVSDTDQIIFLQGLSDKQEYKCIYAAQFALAYRQKVWKFLPKKCPLKLVR